VKYLLGVLDVVGEESLKEIDIYGNGTARSVAQYQDLSGVNFKLGSIAEKARYGGLSQDAFQEDLLNKILLMAGNMNK